MINAIAKLVILGLLFGWADFLVWRRLREEYTDKEIFSFSWFLLTVMTVGAIVGSVIETGRSTLWITAWWGAAGAAVVGVGWWCRKNRWEVWDMADVLAPAAMWTWVIYELMFGWEGGGGRFLAAAGGLLWVAFVKRNYRKFRWYSSGRPGLVSLAALGYFGVYEIVVAFFGGPGIYWGGLKVSQLVSSWLLAFTIVAAYLRSGRRLKEDFGRIVKIKNGKK